MFCVLYLALTSLAAARGTDFDRWSRRESAVIIVRDPWGIAHVHGHSDADAVFGAVYAQAEDDFVRIERNYLAGLGRLAESEGETAVYADLRQRLFLDPRRLPQLYARSPLWLRTLMIAWADALNDYLATHPETQPRVLRHFEPWMALCFTEGSIGGDVESVDLAQLAHFYGGAPATAALPNPDTRDRGPGPGGSNGFALAPSRTAGGHALLWINPHTTFYFRSELQMTSDAGLNAYGAVTWGQFFVYQGFNSRNGWMHTSYGGDAIDEYAEKVHKQDGSLYYAYGAGVRKLKSSHIAIRYRGGAAAKVFTAYHSHHGPIVREEDGRWIAVKLLEDPVRALMQSYLRTKTHDYRSFRAVQDMRTDTSNNTVYADADGVIAYFHGNFIPRRDPRFDFSHPVDGSDPATEWHGAHALGETINLRDPPNGWLLNTNNWPFSAAGAFSPKLADYPRYMWTKGENPRGLHATEVLEPLRDATLDSLIAAAYDAHLTAFEVLLPPLVAAFDRLPADDVRRTALGSPIEELRGWNRRTGTESAATTLAVFWGDALVDLKRAAARAADEPVYDHLVGQLTDDERLSALASAMGRLTQDFGGWRVPWGDVNRFQRLTDDLLQPFDDDQPSLPVGFAPSQWGSLASFDSARPRRSKKIYGSVGNSFVAAVEFGNPVRAKAIMAGGESGHPESPHFNDQAQLYSAGRFREVLFTAHDVAAHAERTYHPGSSAPRTREVHAGTR